MYVCVCVCLCVSITILLMHILIVYILWKVRITYIKTNSKNNIVKKQVSVNTKSGEHI